jgi:glucosylceramidase
MKRLIRNQYNRVAAFFLLTTGLLACDNGKQAQSSEGHADGEVEYWLTTPDKSSLFRKAETGLVFTDQGSRLQAIEIDSEKTYQTIDGFGYSLTGGSAWLLDQKLSPAARAEIIRELFSTDGEGIGVSYLRVSVGSSDLDASVFSYHDLPPGRADRTLSGFSLDEDRKHLIPVLKEILAVNPEIKIMASPWSAPAWMKTNNSPKGGSLKREYYGAFAEYFVKYIQGMGTEGIVIDAITIQNEPENPKNNPSMVMTASEQADFVKGYLGPSFEKAGIKTKIVVFDHNCDNPEYPLAILDDPDAKKYVDGSAFHLYLGEIEAMSKVHNAHPDRHIYFTEQWTSPQGTFEGDMRWHTRHLTVGAVRNWARNVLEWNLAADPDFNPHTDEGGCTMCLGALTIDNNTVTRNVSYYIIAHSSKFVRPGSVRIASSLPDHLPNVAYIAPDGKKVLLVVNDGDNDSEFVIRHAGRTAIAKLPAGSVATYVW